MDGNTRRHRQTNGFWIANEVAAAGIHPADSLHIACAIDAKCDYIITVDKQMTHYKDDRIIVCNPVDFISREERK